MMRRLQGIRLGLAVLAGLVSGCDTLLGLLSPSVVTVVLVNEGDFPVDTTLYYDDTQETPEALLVESGELVELSIPSGGTRTFVRSCDDLQALILEQAALQVVGDIGPEAGTDVLRDGDDFGCGSTITLTFDHSAALLDFDVTVTVDDAAP